MQATMMSEMVVVAIVAIGLMAVMFTINLLNAISSEMRHISYSISSMHNSVRTKSATIADMIGLLTSAFTAYNIDSDKSGFLWNSWMSDSKCRFMEAMQTFRSEECFNAMMMASRMQAITERMRMIVNDKPGDAAIVKDNLMRKIVGTMLNEEDLEMPAMIAWASTNAKSSNPWICLCSMEMMKHQNIHRDLSDEMMSMGKDAAFIASINDGL